MAINIPSHVLLYSKNATNIWIYSKKLTNGAQSLVTCYPDNFKLSYSFWEDEVESIINYKMIDMIIIDLIDDDYKIQNKNKLIWCGQMEKKFRLPVVTLIPNSDFVKISEQHGIYEWISKDYNLHHTMFWKFIINSYEKYLLKAQLNILKNLNSEKI